MAQVNVDHVWKLYSGRGKHGEVVEAVKDVTFVCNDGEFLCLLGPSGCGKSSTLRMIAGLEEITRGNIYIGDTRVNDLHPRDRRVAMAFESYALYPPLTVYENITFPLIARKYPKNAIRERLAVVSQLLDIEDILEERPAKLSGGAQQRVSLARALVREDNVVTLMDEPISHLDAQLKMKLRIDLKEIQREWDMTVIYVTHDQLEALSMADKIVVMDLGEIQQVGTPLELIERPANMFVGGFIGEPPMNFLNLDYRREDGKSYLAAKDLRLEIDGELAIILSSGDRPNWTVGIRPKDIAVDGQSRDTYPLNAEVFSVEPVGETTVLIVDVGGEHLFVEVPGIPQIQEGDNIKIGLRKNRLHLFDTASGRRMN